MTNLCEKIVLLIGGPEGEVFRQALGPVCEPLKVETVQNLDDLQQALTPNSRLICFGSGLIVPGDILKGLNFKAYNIHPGPPDYPGIFPSVHALYDRAKTFGTTVHEMNERVDEGALVHVSRFPISNEMDRLMLDQASFNDVIGLIPTIAQQFILAKNLPTLSESWSGQKKTFADFKALCCLPEGVDEAEFQRRYRAIGEGPDHALEMTIFGHRFILAPQAFDHIVKAGHPVH